MEKTTTEMTCTTAQIVRALILENTNMEEKEWDEDVEWKPTIEEALEDLHERERRMSDEEKSVQDLAEEHLQAEQSNFIRNYERE
jgi:acyl carrier protein phosphodiesterase